MANTVFCPVIEFERTVVPSYGLEIALTMVLTPAIDDYGDKARPTIIESDIIGISTDDDSKIVCNGVVGNLGDLLITQNDSDDAVSMNNAGELVIATIDDDPNLYSRSTEGGDNVLGQYLMYLDANALL